MALFITVIAPWTCGGVLKLITHLNHRLSLGTMFLTVNVALPENSTLLV